jgi:16S rRNA processing protein RimM
MPDPTPPAEQELAIVGVVRKAHGIRGELVVEALTNEPAAVLAAGRRLFGGSPDGKLLREDPKRADSAPLHLSVRRASPFKGGWIVAVGELADRTAAEAWRGRTLLLPYAELTPPGDDEVYLHELVGMRVAQVAAAPEGEPAPVGAVVGLYELPHGLMLEVRLPERKDTVLVPYRAEVVREVDTQQRVILIDPPEGLLE